MFCPTGGRVGWDCYVLPTAGWDGNVTPYRRQGGMGLLRPTGGGGMGMLRPTGGRVGWDCYVLPAVWWDGNVTPTGGGGMEI